VELRGSVLIIGDPDGFIGLVYRPQNVLKRRG
jgi:hypothetical protein